SVKASETAKAHAAANSAVQAEAVEVPAEEAVEATTEVGSEEVAEDVVPAEEAVKVGTEVLNEEDAVVEIDLKN
ncbi:hypothetical protein P5G62_024550, partial [Neobacillus sp. 179-C4.2 HS]